MDSRTVVRVLLGSSVLHLVCWLKFLVHCESDSSCHGEHSGDCYTAALIGNPLFEGLRHGLEGA